MTLPSQTTATGGAKAKRGGKAAKRSSGGDDDDDEEEDEQGDKEEEEEEDEDEESPLGPFYPGQFVSALYDRLQQLHCMFQTHSHFRMLTRIEFHPQIVVSLLHIVLLRRSSLFVFFFSLDISKQILGFATFCFLQRIRFPSISR